MPEGISSGKIGFVGLGRMGRGIAANLLKGGADLVVYDASPAAVEPLVSSGARAAASVAEIAAAADVIFLSLPGPLQVEEVVLGRDGVATHMRAGLVLFDLSTSSRELALKVDAELRSKGGTFFDAPISGGPAGAASGDLVLWIGGNGETLERFLPLLRTVCSHARHVGPIGAGTVTKLAHNMLGYTIMEAQAEAFSLAVRAGLDPLDFWEALRLGMVGRQSPLFMLVNQFLPGVYEPPAFALKLALKDVRLASSLADELGVPMRLSALTREDMENAVANGQGDQDSRAYLRLQLKRAGVDIAVDRERIAAAVRSS